MAVLEQVMPVARGNAKGAYAPPPFARNTCRRPSTQPAHVCARGRTRDSHGFFFSAQLTSAVRAGQRGHAGLLLSLSACLAFCESDSKRTKGKYLAI